MKNYNEYIYKQELNKLLESVELICEEYETGDEITWDIDDKIDKNKIEEYTNSLPKKWKILISKIKKFIINNKNIIKKNPNSFIDKIMDKVNIIKNKKTRTMIIYIVIGIVVFNGLINVSGLDLDKREVSTFVKKLDPIEITKIEIDDEKSKTIEPRQIDNIDGFLKKLAFKESTNDWMAIRYYKKGDIKHPAYVGKYQFGNIAFKDINSGIRVNDFHENPHIWTEEQQDKDIIKLLKNNKHYLRKYYKYIGKEINGIKITESGLLASSHLVGNKIVKKFLNTGGETDLADANGVKCSDYMEQFGGYYLNLN